MKVNQTGHAVVVEDIDLMDDDTCRDLGRIVADGCVVLIRQSVSEQRLYEIQRLWGDPVRGIINGYLADRKLVGPHWRSLALTMARARAKTEGSSAYPGLARVSYERDQRGRPRGFFSNGELDWHSDRQSVDDAQVVIGLMSLWGTEGSQTAFLKTADAYERLSAEDRSMVDELVTVWRWDGGRMSEGLIPKQMEVLNYNMVPMDGMEAPLLSRTASGVKGMRFPSHSFSHFRGMSRRESLCFKDHLWSLLNDERNIYVHDWQDGEIIFMDQNITLHARPTNVLNGDKRTLARMVTHMNHLYSEATPYPYVRYDGRRVGHDEFVAMVDAKRREEFYA